MVQHLTGENSFPKMFHRGATSKRSTKHEQTLQSETKTTTWRMIALWFFVFIRLQRM